MRSFLKLFSIVISISLFVAGCAENSKPDKSVVDIIHPGTNIDLWNGTDLSGLIMVLEDSSADPADVWSVRDGLIYCTGIPSGYFRTEKSYGNYKLHVTWRWPEEPGNSGVLLHMQGPDKVWPKSIEAQLQAENAGDFWVIDGAEINQHTDKSTRRVQKLKDSSENPVGEWNHYEITCSSDSIIVMVNGVLQNVASGATLTSGKICFQSEGKPVEFGKIYLEPLARN